MIFRSLSSLRFMMRTCAVREPASSVESMTNVTSADPVPLAGVVDTKNLEELVTHSRSSDAVTRTVS